MGLGLFGGGVGAARHLIEKGWKVTVTDLRSEDELSASIADLGSLACKFRLGSHAEEDFSQADLVVVNPAVPPTNRFLQVAREGGAQLTSELGLFLEAAPCRLALITGTAGKSSTTSFLVNLLQSAGTQALAGGNIGGSLLANLPELTPDHVVCLEVSSYQLEALQPKAHPSIELVAVTNLGEDHLERYGCAADYQAAKARILTLAASTATAILPPKLRLNPLFACDLRTMDHPGDGQEHRTSPIDLAGLSFDSYPCLPAFQTANVRLALLMGQCLGLDRSQLEAGLKKLAPPPHRAEELGRRGGIRIVDNGVATTPDATLVVLEGETERVTLILGGQPKQGLSFEALVAACARRKDRLVLYGAASEPIAKLCTQHQIKPDCALDFEDAVRCGLKRTPRGGTLLFSPACASFDTHQNFKHRALSFRALLPPQERVEKTTPHS